MNMQFLRRYFAQRAIQRAADSGKNLPKWVQSLVRQDPQLADYYRQQQRLIAKLKCDRKAWGDLHFPPEPEVVVERAIAGGSADFRPRERPRRVVYFSMLVLTACLACVALGLAWRNRGKQSQDPPGLALAESSVTASADLRSLMATANAGGRVAQKISRGAKHWLGRVSSELPVVQQEMRSKLVDNATENLKSTGGDLRSALRRDLRSALRRMATTLGQGVLLPGAAGGSS